jgi:hypothetical protein
MALKDTLKEKIDPEEKKAVITPEVELNDIVKEPATATTPKLTDEHVHALGIIIFTQQEQIKQLFAAMQQQQQIINTIAAGTSKLIDGHQAIVARMTGQQPQMRPVGQRPQMQPQPVPQQVNPTQTTY